MGSIGRKWEPEWSDYRDPFSNVSIRQLTDYRAHSNHLYFTENGWYDHGQRLLFVSDRENRTNLFSLYLADGEITQLTDFGPEVTHLNPCLNPAGDAAYFSTRNRVYKLDFHSQSVSLLYEQEPGYNVGQLSCTADGRYVITALSEDMRRRFRVDLGNGYVGHREIMVAAPHSKIIRIPVEPGPAQILFEEHSWIGHINASTTAPELITFCHEGPWDLVDHRIWGFDLSTQKAWQIRPRQEAHEKVGHEYWFPDGQHIGYHGFHENGVAFFGSIRYDNEDLEEVDFHSRNWHSHSDGVSQVVVDGRSPSDKMMIWRRENGQFVGPKLLCQHRCSFHSQKVHAHPRFSPDGSKLLFTSDKNGYGNLYLVDLPEDIHSLPHVDA